MYISTPLTRFQHHIHMIWLVIFYLKYTDHLHNLMGYCVDPWGQNSMRYWTLPAGQVWSPTPSSISSSVMTSHDAVRRLTVRVRVYAGGHVVYSLDELCVSDLMMVRIARDEVMWRRTGPRRQSSEEMHPSRMLHDWGLGVGQHMYMAGSVVMSQNHHGE